MRQERSSRFSQLYSEFEQAAKMVLEGHTTPHDFALSQTTRLIEIMNVDQRTGLLNSIGLIEMLDVAIKNAIDTNKPLSVIYIDGNQFKKINDTPGLGHDVGDRVITAMVKAIEIFQKNSLKAHITPEGSMGFKPRIISRSNQGGDEFVVACFEELYTAVKFAKLLKVVIPQFVHHEVPELLQYLPDGFSISTGTVELQRGRERRIGEGAREVVAKEDAETLVKRAEQRMYEEKRAERSWRSKLLHVPRHIHDFWDRYGKIHNMR